jgi:hypothetical protein
VSDLWYRFSGLTRSRQEARQPEDVEAEEAEPREDFDLGDDFAEDASECSGYASSEDIFGSADEDAVCFIPLLLT